MDTKEKIKFRTTKVWKDFRKSLLENRGAICELCGTKYSGKRKKILQVHHIDPDNYTDLIPEKFVLLCSNCHETVERISKKVLSKNTELLNKKDWLQLLKNYLPLEAKNKLIEEVKI